jgi:chromosome segregation ATPase
MNDENSRLRKVLAEKDYEVSSLRKKIEDERAVLGSFSTDAAATKIVELAKKVRELTAQLETEKTKNKQLSKSTKDLEEKCERLADTRQTSKGVAGNAGDGDSDSEEKKVSLSKENKELKEKLNQTCHKMMEYKSQCEILKQDVKKYQKALEKEVGENVDIKSILSGQGNWKGRNQQIRNLQSKVCFFFK